MRSKRRSYNRRSYNRNGNSVIKNIAARLAAKVIFDRMLYRRSRRISSRNLVQRRKTYNIAPLIIGAIVASYGGYKIYDYYYGEHSILFGGSDGVLTIGGNIMKSYGKIEESEGFDITGITLTKIGNTVTVTGGNKGYNKVFKNSIDYQLSRNGKYYKFGEFDKPYFYIRKRDLKEVIDFLQK